MAARSNLDTLEGDMTRYSISYKGEHIATGESAGSGWAFWKGINLDPDYDIDAVIERLNRISADNSVHFEHRSGRYFGFPPAFTPTAVEPLI